MKSYWELYSRLYKKAALLFWDKKANQLAASSSFYVILTVIPFILLVTRLVGFFIGDIDQVQQVIFGMSKEAFPEVAPEVLFKIKNIVKGPLFGGASFTFVNFLILTISSLSFFNSIWSGLTTLSENKSHTLLVSHLLGLAVIAFTVFLVIVVFSLQPLILFGAKVFKYNVLVDTIYTNFDWSHGLIEYLRSVDETIFFPVKNNIVQFILFFFYFAALYSWLFRWEIKKRDAFLASATFVFLMILGKSLFWVYFFTLRGRLIESYGDYYTIVVGALWVYLMMCFFYFGICLCVEILKNPDKTTQDNPEPIDSISLES
ncbi:MAG: YihY/virulence factor BrkB family protein [Halobacteriovoraceae bacterium]|nr:YihY/virulence factor BrkB family protein [Halobacteriovoraceae bacterium]